jgi:alpha-tubulin suppressor-like RCC1 family protein
MGAGSGGEESLGGNDAGGSMGESAGAGGVGDPIACVAGTYDSAGSGVCTLWSDCELGAFVGVRGTPTTNRECVACPAGETTTKLNADSCERIVVTQLAAGAEHSCALFSDGSVACWGRGDSGALGYGDFSNIGDDELPSSVGRFSIGAELGLRVTQITAGNAHTCARLSDGSARCWGANDRGQLGRGDANYDPTPGALSAQPIVITSDGAVGVRELVAGGAHTCALLDDGNVVCWGANLYGQLGYGNDDWIGDDEQPVSAGTVSVASEPGVSVAQLAAGAYHTCALLSNGSVKCWGVNDLVLGRGSTPAIGDDEFPSSVSPVSLTDRPGVTATQLTAGQYVTCALLSDGSVRCWGEPGFIGQGDRESRNYTLPSEMQPLQLGAPSGVSVAQVDAGLSHACARFSDGSANCWGWNAQGQLGYGNTENIGDDELPSTAGMIFATTDTASIVTIVGGGWHTCALLTDASVKCWGFNLYGALGVGNTKEISGHHAPAYDKPVALY